jgi:hypothetical protein
LEVYKVNFRFFTRRKFFVNFDVCVGLEALEQNADGRAEGAVVELDGEVDWGEDFAVADWV